MGKYDVSVIPLNWEQMNELSKGRKVRVYVDEQMLKGPVYLELDFDSKQIAGLVYPYNVMR